MCLPGCPTIRVRIPLKATVFSVILLIGKNKNKQKEARYAPFFNEQCRNSYSKMSGRVSLPPPFSLTPRAMLEIAQRHLGQFFFDLIAIAVVTSAKNGKRRKIF